MPFDIGLGELIGLAIVALIVLGPEKLPRYAADAARMLRTVRQMASQARTEVSKELGPDLGGLRDLNPRGLVRKHLLEPVDLDNLETLGDAPAKPAQRRGPGATEGRPPAPRYDEDVT